MAVRELRGEDFDALTESYWELYEERARGEPLGISLFAERPTREMEAAWFATLFQGVLAGDRIAVVAEVDGRAVGLCDIAPVSPGGRSSETGHLGQLGILVHRDHRGRGLGRAMILRALELAQPRFEIVRLWVFSTNEGAKRLYESLGFEVTGRLPAAARRGGVYIDEELMCIDLRNGRPAGPPRTVKGQGPSRGR